MSAPWTLGQNRLCPGLAFLVLGNIPSSCALLFLLMVFGPELQAQTLTYVVDPFNPAGTGGYNYASGQINKVWTNWFGAAFQSATWDSTGDASNNASSGSLKITANFTTANNQFEVYDGLNGLNPALSGLQYTNFQCDVRFAAGSATTTNNGAASFGHLQFGVATASYGQDYFGSIDVSAANTNWVHISLPLNATTDTNLASLSDVLIHIYGPTYSSGLAGASTLWVDNVEFTGLAPSTNGSCTVDGNAVYQRIDGFGASSAWDGSWTTAEADMFFSTNSGSSGSFDGKTNYNYAGIGLSLLRSRIAPGGTTVESTIMQMAQARGARVWSTPWSPAAQFKSNDNVNGGNFLSASNQAYADQLASYVVNMKNTYGVNIYALSVQNEPDVSATYESCLWTAQQIHDFIPYLAGALVASNVGATRIIAAEDEHWETNYYYTALSDPAVATNVGIVACHNYDGSPPVNTPAALPAYANTNAALWETEVSLLSGNDSSITNALYWAGRIHLYLTVAQANAWHYWWLEPGDTTGNESLVDTNGVPAKRMYALGQFSRFVRPGYYRIGVPNNSGPAQISSYQDSASQNFALVAINNNATPVSQTFVLTNLNNVSSVTPWITSSNYSLASQTPAGVTNQTFTYTLPALSIVTFAGQAASNPPPVLATVAGQKINAGVTLMLTNAATDTAIPARTLTFSLLSAPTNALLTTVNGTNGIFTWRPLVSQANTTNPVTVRVADNGTPSLSATNYFTITVNPITAPVLGSIGVANGTVTLTVNGEQGPDYSLLASTNLTDWLTLLATNSPLMPLRLADTNSGASARFYRIQAGP